MENWHPYAEVAGQIESSIPDSQPNGPIACPNCGMQVEPDNLASVGNTQVCPYCKDEYVQRLKEGVEVTRLGYQYGGFWIRFCALFVDGIILNVIQWILSFVLMQSSMSSNEVLGPRFVILQTLSVLIPICYYVFFNGHPSLQATPGKLACRLRVITGDGQRVTYIRALGRYFASILSGMILGIGFLICIWDSEKRTLHDRICNTRVIRR